MAQQNAFPKTLEGFGYGFNDKGQLRQIDPSTGLCTDKPFEFAISSEHERNQQHYEALGDVITEYVYELLEKNGLHKIYIPSDVPESDATFVFATKRDLKDVKKLLILINGSGVVRAGQWARRLIMNQSLDHGTQIPYIKLARQNGYDVLVLNTNDNERNDEDIPGHASPSEHANSVWSQMIADANIEAIAIVAHSFGGVVTMDLAHQHAKAFRNQVFAVGLTDSVHMSLPPGIREHLQNIGRNWVTSAQPLNTPSKYQHHLDVQRLSAGHKEHEWTSWSAIDVLFEFLEERYKNFVGNETAAKETKVEL
ncbi:hypothetical protein HA402_007669 [Bradysia odoriphaga]|nr:hypothetical protein HA402_007669 [Bradysia odoriphaga]